MATVTTTDFGAALSNAIHGGYVAHLSGGTYSIASPIVIHVTSTIQGALGIDGGGATLVSQVTDGSPLIQIVVHPGVDFRYLTLSNFTILGNGQEGSGIQVIADGNDQWAYNWTISDVTVEHVGGYGLDMRGSIFEGLIVDSWMDGNARGGAYFSHSAAGGVVSALRWVGGGARDNGDAGVILDNGVRDLGVDGATFAGNAGPGIYAPSGITSVNNSTFEDNIGYGVAFQNYGSFDGNTFATSGIQTAGITGYVTGNARLEENTAVYTGAGADRTILADLQGAGGLFVADNIGRIVNGPQLSPNVSGGDLTEVTRTTAGVALPRLAAVTTATTAPVPDSTGTGLLETTLRDAIAGGRVVHLTGDTYTVTTPIVINVTRSTAGPVGIDLGGAKIFSQVANGLPVIEIRVAPGVQLGSLTLSNFSIIGNGREGDGVKIVADGPDRSIHDWSISNVNVEHVGGIGLDVLGNVSHGTVSNSWMHGNDQGGARFAASAGGGVPVDLEWIAGGTRKNGIAGLMVDNGARDMTVSGAYFVDNDGPGIVATSGIALVEASGFENNLGVGVIVLGPASFAADTFATYGRQTTGVGGYLAGSRVTLAGVGSEYYGPGADPTVMVNVQGRGTLAVAGGGNVLAAPSIAVTGLLATVIESEGVTSLVEDGGGYILSADGSSGPQLQYGGAAVIAGQSGAWAPIGAEAVAGGYLVAWHFGTADQYSVWFTDGNGNFVDDSPGTVSGSSLGLQSQETLFGQDLNGDGTTGIVMTEIETVGGTTLVQAADTYALHPAGGSSGPQLRNDGAAVIAGQSGVWAPIGAEAVAGGYLVAWHFGTADQYSVWFTDGAGNFVNSPGIVSGSGLALQSQETLFGQDLNGDGTIGIMVTEIEAVGGTALVQAADTYTLHPAGGSSGPQLRNGGAAVIAGQSGAWAPIGAEAVVGGYLIAWHFGTADQYSVWFTDGSGNFVNSPGIVSSSSLALQSQETLFGQDLNGDGTTGIVVTEIEAVGGTALVQAADTYALHPAGGSSGPQLRNDGAAVIAGQSGAWAPIGAEAVAGGYLVAWHFGTADQYSVWFTDGSGNFVNSPGIVSGSSLALQSQETLFGQDLNGDGTIGVPPSLQSNDWLA